MKIKILIFSILFIYISNYLISKEKYINNDIGFSFIIPNGLSVKENLTGDEYADRNNFNKQYNILISLFKMDDKQYENDYQYNGFLERLNKMQKKQGFLYIFGFGERGKELDNIFSDYFEYKGKIIGQIQFSMFDLEMGFIHDIITKDLYFIENNYLIKIELRYYDLNFQIVNRFPEYIKKESNQYYSWKDPVGKNCEEFYDLIKNKSPKGPSELIKLEEYFDEILKSLELFQSGKRN